jgi:hypothetical protein
VATPPSWLHAGSAIVPAAIAIAASASVVVSIICRYRQFLIITVFFP